MKDGIKWFGSVILMIYNSDLIDDDIYYYNQIL